MSTESRSPRRPSDVTAWSDEVDVLVVGAGMGGACAAIEAARAGARVLVLDRGGPGTCTTAMAGGHFYLGGGTAVQQATGHEDSAGGDGQVPPGRQPRGRPGEDPPLLRGLPVSTSTGSRGWGSSSNGPTTRRRPSYSPAPRA